MLQKNEEKKIFLSFCGGTLFVGAPVRPNMLNMSRSASANGTAVSTDFITFLVE